MATMLPVGCVNLWIRVKQKNHFQNLFLYIMHIIAPGAIKKGQLPLS